MPTFTPPINPSIGRPLTTEFKLLRSNFGDGYEQVAADGINYIREVWELSFEALTDAEMNEIRDFFVDTVEGYASFEYTLPGEETARNFRLDGDKINREPLSGGLWRVSFKVREVFVF